MIAALRRTVVGFLVAGLAGVALAACGAGSHHSPADPQSAAVRQTMHRALVALADGHGRAFCRLVSTRMRAALAHATHGASCPRVVTLVATRLDAGQKQALRQVSVGAVTVAGRGATVPNDSVSSAGGPLRTFLGARRGATLLTRQSSGRWQISG